MITLPGWRVMVVEDNFILALEVQQILEGAGAHVQGPFGNVKSAQASLDEQLPDCAVLDVNLGAGASFDLARTLLAHAIPFLFFTGYDQSVLPPEFATIRRLEKPVDTTLLLRGLKDCREAPQSNKKASCSFLKKRTKKLSLTSDTARRPAPSPVLGFLIRVIRVIGVIRVPSQL